MNRSIKLYVERFIPPTFHPFIRSILSAYRAIARVFTTRFVLDSYMFHRYRFGLYAKTYGTIKALILYYRIHVGFGLLKLYAPGIAQPLFIRRHTSDIRCFEQVFLSKEYDLEDTPSISTIVDAGANVGFASVYFANRWPQARILSIEPEQSNIKMLKKNTAGFENITVVEAALWIHKNGVTLENPAGDKWTFRAKETTQGIIPSVTIYDTFELLKTSHVDLFKLDIEGGEKELLCRDSSWLNSVGLLILETHDKFIEGCEAALTAALKPLMHTRTSKGENTIIRFTDRVSTAERIN